MKAQYSFKVPPTKQMGSYSSTASANNSETVEENALWDYNHARSHDGLPPLKQMPQGTVYNCVNQHEL